MSLSFVTRLAAFLCLAIVSGWLGREYALPLASYLTDAQELTARDAHISKRSIVYRIPRDEKVAFAFSQPVTRAKIIVAPAVREEMQAFEQGFVYGLRVRWVSAEGRTLSEHEVHLQAASPDDVFRSGDAWRFFRSAPELVAEQDHLLVDSDDLAATIELEAFDIDEGIVGIDVRVFEQRSYSDAQALAAYRRLGKQSRDLLTLPNAFPSDMLSDKEKAALARNHWRAVGPLGLDGRDYSMLVLYEAVKSDMILDGTQSGERGL